MVELTADEVLVSLANATLTEPVKEAVLDLIREDKAGVPALLDPTDPLFLTAIEVEGFRGIGPSSVLKLVPGPGLTLVVGSNGCGKSTFAEALERVLSGTTMRWESSASDAKED